VSLTIIDPAPHKQRFRAIWTRLPSRVQGLPVTIRELTEYAWHAAGGQPEHTGLTLVENGACLISLRTGNARFRFPEDVLHELMHVVAARSDGISIGLFPVEQWAPWVAFWTARRASFPTPYAKTDPSEGWAETGPEVLGGKVYPGYRPLTKAIRAEVRRIVGL
jgi:hypothetical protein